MAERFYHHQACLTRAPERSTKQRKKQPVQATLKMNQMVKSINTMKKLLQLWAKQLARIKIAGSNSHITILTLNANGLKSPIKRHRLANWIKSQNPKGCCIQETHHTCKDTHRLKIKGQRKIYQAHGEQKKNPGVAILVSDKIDVKLTKTKRDKEGYYIMVKGSMQQEEQRF